MADDDNYFEAGQHQLDRNSEEQTLREVIEENLHQPTAFDADPNYNQTGSPDYTEDEETGNIDYHEDQLPGSNPREVAKDLGVDTID